MADPFWTAEPPPKKQCMKEAEAAFKLEGGGHVTNEAPGCKTPFPPSEFRISSKSSAD